LALGWVTLLGVLALGWVLALRVGLLWVALLRSGLLVGSPVGLLRCPGLLSHVWLLGLLGLLGLWGRWRSV
jgi:hypothetical protein